MKDAPGDCRFTKTHEWVRKEGAVAVVGISDHAQDALGDITFVELPKLGGSVTKAKECGVIESVKAASDLFSPISGTVSALNQALEDTPELINQEPYNAGWLFKVKSFDPAEFSDMMDGPAYQAFLESEK